MHDLTGVDQAACSTAEEDAGRCRSDATARQRELDALRKDINTAVELATREAIEQVECEVRKHSALQIRELTEQLAHLKKKHEEQAAESARQAMKEVRTVTSRRLDVLCADMA